MSAITINQFSESIWKIEEEKFKRLEKEIRIPNESLNEVDFVSFEKQSDFDLIPDKGGCYWIWTNEPVKHRFHRNRIPPKINGGELIYNGVAKDNVQKRIMHHLLGERNADWSGVSLDIYFDESRSHRKKVFSINGLLPEN